MGKNIAVIGIVAVIATSIGVAIKAAKDKKYFDANYNRDEYQKQDNE